MAKPTKPAKSAKARLTTIAGAPVPDNQNIMTAGPRGPPCCRMSGCSRNSRTSTAK